MGGTWHTGPLGSAVTAALAAPATAANTELPAMVVAAAYGVPVVRESWVAACEAAQACVPLKDHLLFCSAPVCPQATGKATVRSPHRKRTGPRAGPAARRDAA